MSIADLRARLAALLDDLPVSQLSEVLQDIEDVAAVVTIRAQYWVREPGEPPVERTCTVETAEQVREFVAVLAGDRVGDALLAHSGRPRVETLIPDEDEPGGFRTVPDHSVIVGVHGDRGAMSYRGSDGHGADPVHLYTRGSGPGHPVLYETDEFPPRCEIGVEELTGALIEFLQTANRPLTLQWQQPHDDHPAAAGSR